LFTNIKIFSALFYEKFTPAILTTSLFIMPKGIQVQNKKKQQFYKSNARRILGKATFSNVIISVDFVKVIGMSCL